MIIIPAGDRSTETELSRAVVLVLHTQPYGEADFPIIFENVPRLIRLTEADCQRSNARDAEMKWQTLVRNIAAHSKVAGNAIHNGVLARRPGGGYRLAEHGAVKHELHADETVRYSIMDRLLYDFGLNRISAEKFWWHMNRCGYGQDDIDWYLDRYYKRQPAARAKAS